MSVILPIAVTAAAFAWARRPFPAGLSFEDYTATLAVYRRLGGILLVTAAAWLAWAFTR